MNATLERRHGSGNSELRRIDPRALSEAGAIQTDFLQIHRALHHMSQILMHGHNGLVELPFALNNVVRLGNALRYSHTFNSNHILDEVLQLGASLKEFENSFQQNLFTKDFEVKNTFNHSIIDRYNKLVDVLKLAFKSVRLGFHFEHMPHIG